MKKKLEQFKKALSILLLSLLVSGLMPATAMAAGEIVTDLTLIEVIDGGADIERGELTDGAVINLAKYPKINVRANTNPSTVGSVRFALNANNNFRTENVAPYALNGDISGNYNTWIPAVGSYTLKATPYEGSGATGAKGTEKTISFTVVNDSTAPVINGAEDGEYYNTDRVITFSDDQNPNPKATLDGNSVTSPLTVTAEGSYVLVVDDEYGNKATVNFTIDKTAPVITLKGANPMVVEKNSTFVDPGYLVDDTSPVEVEKTGTVFSNIIGDYTITYNAEDEAGNVAVSVERTVQVRDTAAPVLDAGADIITNGLLGVVAKTDATVTDASLVTLEWIAETGITFTPSDQLSTEISAHLDGQYLITLKATDAEGNVSTDTFTLVWDSNAPTPNAGDDKSTGKEVTMDGSASSDATSGIASYLWQVKEKPLGASPILGSATEATTTFAADLEGEYVLSLLVTDKAGNYAVDEVVVIWDVTAPSPLKGFYLVTGSGYVDLHWEEPTDADFAGVVIYRSEVAEELGEALDEVEKGITTFSDESVENGKTYYYTLVPYDTAGNLGEETETISASPVAPATAPIVLTPVAEAAPTLAPKVAKESAKEVKSAVKENKEDQADTEEKGEQKEVPVFGIIILVILALVGVYLLYLQNPELLKKLNFLKKK